MTETNKFAARKHRAIARFEETVGAIAIAEQKERKQIETALGASLYAALPNFTDEEIVNIFAALEAKATASQRKHIRKHPDYPEISEVAATPTQAPQNLPTD